MIRRRGEEALLRRLSSWVLLSSVDKTTVCGLGGEWNRHDHVKHSDRDSRSHSGVVGHSAVMRMMMKNSFSSSVGMMMSHEDNKKKRTRRKKTAADEEGEYSSSNHIVEKRDDSDSSITDRIPPEYLKKGPVSVAEGTSYTVIILAALGFAAAVAYAAVSELLLSPKEYTCFSKALKKIEEDPRVTIRLGTPVHGYGSESRNRAARQRIPHRIYKDEGGKEHVQIQFHASGPSGRAVVYADMYEDENGVLNEYKYLTVRVLSPVPHDVVLV